MEPTQQELAEAFTYDPDEPFALRYRYVKKKARVRVGDVAGYWHAIRAGMPEQQRYIEVRRDSKRYRIPLHHAVWIYHNGTLPEHGVAFRDKNIVDFRLPNLMETPPRRTYREQVLWSFYRITEAEYDRRLEAQGGVCAICGKAETVKREVKYRRPEQARVDLLSVDHCHGTNTVRGLLCANCNNGLGRFKDNSATLRRAADYLDAHQAVAVAQPPRKAQRKRLVARKALPGAYLPKRSKRWIGRITVDYKIHYLGYFATAEEAHAAYLKAKVELRGEGHRDNPSIAGKQKNPPT